MFYQLGYGGETPPNDVFFPVLRMSFFLYFAAKAATGVAAITLGMVLWQTLDGGVWRNVVLVRLGRCCERRRNDVGTGRGAFRGCGLGSRRSVYRTCADSLGSSQSYSSAELTAGKPGDEKRTPCGQCRKPQFIRIDTLIAMQLH